MFDIALYGKALPDKVVTALGRFAESTACLPTSKRLARPVCDHPDTLLFCDGDILIGGAEYVRENREFFNRLGLSPAASNEPQSPYPGEAALNAFTVEAGGKRTLIGRLSSLAAELLARYDSRINVNQGYARCSVAPVAPDAFITADTGIAKAVERAGGKTLLIRPGHIALDGHEYGFIGGASALCKDNVLFFGDITTHPDHTAIIKFIEHCGKEAISLSDGILTDSGGVIFCNRT